MYLGKFGSGKTEIAINHTLALARAGARPWLVDLDTVTPFFRSRDLRERLEESGARVVASAAHADLPALPPEIHSALQAGDDPVVIDLGGDRAGARVLGAWRDYMVPGQYRALFVVNACRPFTGDAAGIARAVGELEAVARIKVTDLVSNTHLGRETTPGVVLEGDRVVRHAARQLGLPVAFLVIREGLADPESFPPPVVVIRPCLGPPFGPGGI